MFNAVGSTRTSSAEKTAGLIVEIDNGELCNYNLP